MNARSSCLSRRAVMGSLGASGAALVLSACGEGAKPAVARTDEGASSPSASSITSGSALPSDESVSASPSPSTSSHYSGKSKAPEGEYRPADFYGPAQNVQKPKTEEGYTNASLEGMRKTVQAWTEWRNYGMQTGDYSEAKKLISKDFTNEKKSYDFDSGLYKKGGWIMGGDSHKYEFHGEPINQGNGKYEWKFFLVWSHVIYVEANGKDYREVSNKDYEDNWYTLSLHHDGNRWLIDNVSPIELDKK